MLKVFGLINDNNIGFSLNETNVNKEKIIEPFIESIINFRNKVRKISKDVQLLKESDILRDEILPNFGVKLEDKDGGTIWKFDNPENIKLQIAQKNTKNEEKEKQKNEILLRKKTKEEKMKIPPRELFRGEPIIYSKFDNEDIPTHNNEGKPISKSLYKKLKKIMDRHKQNYEK